MISALSVTTYWHRLLKVALPLKLLEHALENGGCRCGFAQGSVLGEGPQSPRSLNLNVRHERAYERASSCGKWTSRACAGAVLVCSACLPCARASSSALPLPLPHPSPSLSLSLFLSLSLSLSALCPLAAVHPSSLLEPRCPLLSVVRALCIRAGPEQLLLVFSCSTNNPAKSDPKRGTKLTPKRAQR